MTTATAPAPAAPAQAPAASPSAGGGTPGGGPQAQGGPGQAAGGLQVTVTTTVSSPIRAPEPQRIPQGQGQDPNAQQPNQAKDQQRQQEAPAKEKGILGRLMDWAKDTFKDLVGIGNGKPAQYHTPGQAQNGPEKPRGQQQNHAPAPAQGQGTKITVQVKQMSPEALAAARSAGQGAMDAGAQHKGAAGPQQQAPSTPAPAQQAPAKAAGASR